MTLTLLDKYMLVIYPQTTPKKRKQLIGEIYMGINSACMSDPAKCNFKWKIPVWLPKWDINNIIEILSNKGFSVRHSVLLSSLLIMW